MMNEADEQFEVFCLFDGKANLKFEDIWLWNPDRPMRELGSLGT
jgi:hypothetical protein